MPRKTDNPLKAGYACGARTRYGSKCKTAAMPNGRCRMHGGKSTGAPLGNQNALKHGRYSAWAKAMRAVEAMGKAGL